MSKTVENTISLSSRSESAGPIDSNKGRPNSSARREFDCVLDVRGRGKYSKYLIRWHAGDDYFSTWETLSALERYRTELREFMRRRSLEKTKAYQRKVRAVHDQDMESMRRRSCDSANSFIENQEEEIFFGDAGDSGKSNEPRKRLMPRTSRDENIGEKVRRPVGRPRLYPQIPSDDYPSTKRKEKDLDLTSRIDEFIKIRQPDQTNQNSQDVGANNNANNCTTDGSAEKKEINILKARDRIRAHDSPHPPDSNLKSKGKGCTNVLKENPPKISRQTIPLKFSVDDDDMNDINQRRFHDKSQSATNPLSEASSFEVKKKKFSSAKQTNVNLREDLLADQVADEDIIKAAEKVIAHIRLNSCLYFRLDWNSYNHKGLNRERFFPYDLISQSNPRILLDYLKDFIKYK